VASLRITLLKGFRGNLCYQAITFGTLTGLVSDSGRMTGYPECMVRRFAGSHAAAIKHTVIRVEKTMGVVKAYLQLNAVTATKQMASAHAMLRTRAKVSAGSPPSSHANTAANKRNTEKKSPNALKKSQ
jgi:hypothetical protein